MKLFVYQKKIWASQGDCLLGLGRPVGVRV